MASRPAFVAAILAAALIASSSASAASIVTPKVSVSTIVEFGNNLKPVTIDQNSQINIARIIQIGGNGTVDATVVQNGTTNYTTIFQAANTTNALVAQTGVTNTAYITQVGGANNSLLGQLGSLNVGSILQFGHTNWSRIFQWMR